MTVAGMCPVGAVPKFPIPRDPRCPFDPAKDLMVLARESPIYKVLMWDGREAWLATRIDDVRKILTDPRFSAVPVKEKMPAVSAALKAAKVLDHSFLRQDDPEHAVGRQKWQPFFYSKNVSALRPDIERYVVEAIGNLLASGPPADFVEHVALQVPSRVIAQLLDIPREDHEFFQTESANRARISESPEILEEANRKLMEYWRHLVAQRSQNPGNDLVSQLIKREIDAGTFDAEEIVAGAHLILFAGHDTTSNMIALGTMALLQQPHLIERIKADPSVTPRVVEELLRIMSIVQNGLTRIALEDVEIGGQAIAAGEGVIAHLAAANRDESLFSHGQEIDPDRPVRAHVAFGAGPHFCIGAQLARTELQIALDTIFRRIPTLALAVDPQKADFKYDGLFFGLHTLPVTW